MPSASGLLSVMTRCYVRFARQAMLMITYDCSESVLLDALLLDVALYILAITAHPRRMHLLIIFRISFLSRFGNL
jgi:hypothetical protein